MARYRFENEMIPFEIPVVRGYTTLAKTNRPDVKMPLCERSRFIRPHQDTPSSIIRHYISRYSTTQFHWIYPSAEDKKKKEAGRGGKERKKILISDWSQSDCRRAVGTW